MNFYKIRMSYFYQLVVALGLIMLILYSKPNININNIEYEDDFENNDNFHINPYF